MRGRRVKRSKNERLRNCGRKSEKEKVTPSNELISLQMTKKTRTNVPLDKETSLADLAVEEHPGK